MFRLKCCSGSLTSSSNRSLLKYRGMRSSFGTSGNFYASSSLSARSWLISAVGLRIYTFTLYSLLSQSQNNFKAASLSFKLSLNTGLSVTKLSRAKANWKSTPPRTPTNCDELITSWSCLEIAKWVSEPMLDCSLLSLSLFNNFCTEHFAQLH